MLQFSLTLYCLIYSALLFSVSCPRPPSLLGSLLTDSLPSGRLSDKWGQMEPCHCCCWPQLSSLRLLLSSALTVLFISTITRLVLSVWWTFHVPSPVWTSQLWVFWLAICNDFLYSGVQKFSSIFLCHNKTIRKCWTSYFRTPCNSTRLHIFRIKLDQMEKKRWRDVIALLQELCLRALKSVMAFFDRRILSTVGSQELYIHFDQRKLPQVLVSASELGSAFSAG